MKLVECRDEVLVYRIYNVELRKVTTTEEMILLLSVVNSQGTELNYDC